jgi:hypothetical protein
MQVVVGRSRLVMNEKCMQGTDYTLLPIESPVKVGSVWFGRRQHSIVYLDSAFFGRMTNVSADLRNCMDRGFYMAEYIGNSTAEQTPANFTDLQSISPILG